MISDTLSILVTLLGVRLVMRGEFTPGMVFAFQGFLSSFMSPAQLLISSGQQMQEMRTNMERIEDVMEYPDDPAMEAGAGMEQEAEGSSGSKLSGELIMRGVTFGYSRLEEPLIRDFHLELKKGKSVAFVGASGCGKSTLLRILLGFENPEKGTVCYDNNEMSPFDNEALVEETELSSGEEILGSEDGPVIEEIPEFEVELPELVFEGDPVNDEPVLFEQEESTEDQTENVVGAEPVAFDQSVTVNGTVVTVNAEPGVFPADAELSVEQAPFYKQAEAEAAVEEVRDEDQNVAISYTFDIKVIDPVTGEEIQPAAEQTVGVSFGLPEVADENLITNVYHVTEEEATGELTAQALDVIMEAAPETGEETTAAVETNGFSLYTVEFTYNALRYALPGDTSVSMSEILEVLGLTGEVTAVEVSDTGLFSAGKETGEWILTAHQAFDTEEWMKVTINGVTYEITVTDAKAYKITIQGSEYGYAALSSGMPNPAEQNQYIALQWGVDEKYKYSYGFDHVDVVETNDPTKVWAQVTYGTDGTGNRPGFFMPGCDVTLIPVFYTKSRVVKIGLEHSVDHGTLILTDNDEEPEIIPKEFSHLTMPAAEAIVSVEWENTEPELPTFTSHSLLLSSSIGINFFMRLPELPDVDYNDSFMEFYVSNRIIQDSFDAGHWDESGKDYCFTVYVTSVEMAEPIDAVFHYGDGQTVSSTYSVRDYIIAYEEVEDRYDAETTRLVHAIADYGHHVQPVLSVTNNWTIGLDYHEMDKYYTESFDYDVISNAVAEHEAWMDPGTSGISKMSYTMNLLSRTQLYIYLYYDKGFSETDKVIVDGIQVSPIKSGSRYYVQTSALSAHQLDVTFEVEVKTDTGTALMTVSPLDYINYYIRPERSDLERKAVSAVYNYYKAARNYLNTH